ncbi:unnamed protein product [Allacma fusca]|uniref:Uncharacterized protein n=1 Tax=Allacma fusca TaxID=39272 RepID=A0A8J2JZ68_9HEXA|nr:unnamed protein product [Allacma fusca]
MKVKDPFVHVNINAQGQEKKNNHVYESNVEEQSLERHTLNILIALRHVRTYTGSGYILYVPDESGERREGEPNAETVPVVWILFTVENSKSESRSQAQLGDLDTLSVRFTNTDDCICNNIK